MDAVAGIILVTVCFLLNCYGMMRYQIKLIGIMSNLSKELYSLHKKEKEEGKTMSLS